MRRLSLIGLLALTLVPLSATQRDPPPQPGQPIFRTSSTLATIDAVVTDDDGRPVTDLTKDDFEVKVSGKRQELQQAIYIRAGSPIQSDSVINLPNAAGATAPSAAPGLSSASAALKASHGGAGRITRTIAFVVDDLSLSFESTFYVRRALTKYIETQVQPGDLVAIVRTASGSGALQQFTTDTRLLKMAVDRVQWDYRSRNGVSSFEAFTPEFSGPRRKYRNGCRDRRPPSRLHRDRLARGDTVHRARHRGVARTEVDRAPLGGLPADVRRPARGRSGVERTDPHARRGKSCGCRALHDRRTWTADGRPHSRRQSAGAELGRIRGRAKRQYRASRRHGRHQRVGQCRRWW